MHWFLEFNSGLLAVLPHEPVLQSRGKTNAFCVAGRVYGHAGPGASGHGRWRGRYVTQVVCGRRGLDGDYNRLGAGRTLRRPGGAGIRKCGSASEPGHYAGLGGDQRGLLPCSFLLVSAVAGRNERRNVDDSALRTALEAHARSCGQARHLLHQRGRAQPNFQCLQRSLWVPWCW